MNESCLSNANSAGASHWSIRWLWLPFNTRKTHCVSIKATTPIISWSTQLHWGPVHPSEAERGPSLESIYQISLTVGLSEGNKIISLKKFISPQPVGGPSKRKKKSGSPGHVPSVSLTKSIYSLLSELWSKLATVRGSLDSAIHAEGTANKNARSRNLAYARQVGLYHAF